MLEANEPPGAREEVSRLRSELEAANRTLVESYRMASLGRLVTSLAHEMNTPIASILSNNAVILRSLGALQQVLSECSTIPAPQRARVLEIVGDLLNVAEVDRIACERISALIPGLKTFARVEETEPHVVDLNQILRNALAIIHGGFRPRVTFETDLGELPLLECYPQSLYQVFVNILTNAGQAIEGQGKVTVRTRRERDRVCISISDTGSGIKPVDRS